MLLGGAALAAESRKPYWLLALLILLIDGCGHAVAQPWPTKPKHRGTQVQTRLPRLASPQASGPEAQPNLVAEERR